MIRSFFTFLAIFFSISQQNIAQSSDTKFGDVSVEELQMSYYPADSSAGAVVLFDKGYFNGDDFLFTRHLRVKILKKSGFDWGNWTFNTPGKSFFKVSVFNLESGEITESKADKNNIYSEEVIDKFDVYKVFAPNIKIGSVVDITYTFNGFPNEWRFQQRIPVIYNELEIIRSTYVSFNKTLFGFEEVDQIEDNKWIAQNIPAFISEPYSNHYTNYITRFEFQLEEIAATYWGTKRFYAYSKSWESIIRHILENNYFGGVLRGSGFLNEKAKELKKSNIPVSEKIKLAVEYIRNQIKYNGSKSIYATPGLRQNFLSDHSGNSAEVNLLLITLLNKIGIKTTPVLLSTRDNGFIVPFTPTYDKLNFVIGFVELDDGAILVDATSKFSSPGVIPEFCLNGEGILASKNEIKWVSLISSETKPKYIGQFISINIDDKAQSNAQITQMYKFYGFTKWIEDRNDSDNNDEIYISSIEEKFENINISSYAISKIDTGAMTATESLSADISSMIINTGSELYISPSVLFEFTENPFKKENRKYPVDFIYPHEINRTVTIKYPEYFNVKSIPKSIKMTSAGGSAEFTFLSNQSPNGIQLRVLLSLKKSFYTEEEYLELKMFFSEVISKVNARIELTKKT